MSRARRKEVNEGNAREVDDEVDKDRCGRIESPQAFTRLAEWYQVRRVSQNIGVK